MTRSPTSSPKVATTAPAAAPGNAGNASTKAALASGTAAYELRDLFGNPEDQETLDFVASVRDAGYRMTIEETAEGHHMIIRGL